ncbi:MAG TPA: divalent metal cation transporter [Alicyclobacillus sp.]|nr:divalent metal cation transporter [Alicyclobacillus sp.]
MHDKQSASRLSTAKTVTDLTSKLHIPAQDKKSWRRWVWLFWALLGPGLLAMLGDNDAGGVIAYAVTGAQFGIGFFVPLLFCLAPLTFTIQEMSMRLGVVTQTGFSKLVFRQYGRFWGFYHITTLALENLLTLVTEFIGMTAGLVMLGLPLWASDGICLTLTVSFVLFTGYWTKERLALFIGAANLVFLVAAWMTQPSMATIVRAFQTWNLPSVPGPGGDLIWYILATIGNAVAPWMIFFQSSAVIDKGMTPEDLNLGRIDTALGSLMQTIVAMGVMICGAALFGHVQDIGDTGPSTMIRSLYDVAGRWPAILLGIGLFNAGFLAAITISLSSSWTIAEAFGWLKSLNDRLSTAPKFYAVYIGSILCASLAILIPDLPLNFISVVTQVIGGILMAPILIFLVLMTSNKKLMGNYKNGLVGSLWGWIMVTLLIALTAATFWKTLISL